jgi:tRNA(fMet)-specific endonuclease VapC
MARKGSTSGPPAASRATAVEDMILLDTDHLSVLKYPESPRCRPLVGRMEASGEGVFATTIVSVEEQMRGWLALIHKTSDIDKHVALYEQLFLLFDLFHRWEVLPFDRRAAAEFRHLRKLRLRLGTQDLKIACIALVEGVRLLSANLRDFQRVPGLRVESWLD